MSTKEMNENEKRNETLIKRRIDLLYEEVKNMAGQRSGGSPECEYLLQVAKALDKASDFLMFAIKNTR